MKNKKEIVQEGSVQGQPREKQLRNIENDILKLFNKNDVTFLEWEKLISCINFNMRKYCKIVLPENPED